MPLPLPPIGCVVEDLQWVDTMTRKNEARRGRSLEARATTISPDEAAERLGLRASTLSNLRWSGRGPTYLKVCGRVRYRTVDIADWLDEQERTSTSSHQPTAKPDEEE